ncbi:hypothetical protein [Sinosporangium siamense]|uniref:Uncharacterized protein n=1 Tax=Sinosporangium siamense TaxID=1367973 RepID=A0A919RKX5_9ACTN|nr:hypothetical protein [Sinosporangium siamense]GII95721.1 hypothetical protein Ssi02_59520 [Sinosporangium siamense]
MTPIELEELARAKPRGRHARPEPVSHPEQPFQEQFTPFFDNLSRPRRQNDSPLPRHATADDAATMQFPAVVATGPLSAPTPADYAGFAGPGDFAGPPVQHGVYGGGSPQAGPDIDVGLALRRLRDAALQAVADIDIALR